MNNKYVSGTYIRVVIVFPVHKHDCNLKHGPYVPYIWILHVIVINNNRYNNNKPLTTRRPRTRSRICKHSVVYHTQQYRASGCTANHSIVGTSVVPAPGAPSPPAVAVRVVVCTRLGAYFVLSLCVCSVCVFVVVPFFTRVSCPVCFVRAFGRHYLWIVGFVSRTGAALVDKSAKTGSRWGPAESFCWPLSSPRPSPTVSFPIWNNVYKTKQRRTESDLFAYAYRQHYMYT